MLGQVCEFVTEADGFSAGALLASLAPPANVWRGHTTTATAFIPHREREPRAGVIHFFPLTDVEQKVQAALGVIQPAAESTAVESIPITQRIHAELAELRHSLRR